jgi:hypothetical protein
MAAKRAKTDHVHEHVNVYVNVDVNVDVLVNVDGSSHSKILGKRERIFSLVLRFFS